METEVEQHFEELMQAIGRGSEQVVPFLGAGVGLCERTQGVNWTGPNGDSLPDANELAKYLVHDYGPEIEADVAREIRETKEGRQVTFDLLRTSQYLHTTKRNRGLLETRVAAAIQDVERGTCVHDLCAALPGLLRRKGFRSNLLFVTTNYDLLLEREFCRVGQEYDLVTFATDEGGKAKFALVTDGEVHFLGRSQTGQRFFEERPVIFKIHGSLHPCEGIGDKFVITENDYLDYIVEYQRLIPRSISDRMKLCRFLFLGYSLSDWNIRAVLRGLEMKSRLNVSWAVQRRPSEFQRGFWAEHKVSLVACPLADYTSQLRQRLESIPER